MLDPPLARAFTTENGILAVQGTNAETSLIRKTYHIFSADLRIKRVRRFAVG
jgi:hypothetical protein